MLTFYLINWKNSKTNDTKKIKIKLTENKRKKTSKIYKTDFERTMIDNKIINLIKLKCGNILGILIFLKIFVQL